MTAIEVTGKSLDEAKRLAADKLGVSADTLDVTVLEEAKGKGLFGQSKVRIRAEARATETAVAVLPETVDPEAQEKAKEAFLSEGPAVVKTEKKPARSTGGRRGAKKTEEEPVAAAAEEPPAEVRNGEAEPEPREEVVATQEHGDQMVALLDELLNSASLSVSAKVTQISGRYVTIEIDGKDVAFLVGKHGEVLNAMQYLLNIIAGRKFNNGVRATLDGNNYRHRREEALTKLATNIANEVKARSEEAVLDALPAFERRIVHKALADFEGISTYSEGEEPNRRVVIAPAD